MPSTAVVQSLQTAHDIAVKAPFPQVVVELSDVLGARLCAYLGSVKETRAVRQWADGARTPSAEVQRRLRVALQVATSLAASESAAVAQVWFQGLNPLLDDRSPLGVLRDDDLDECGPAVIGAARAFMGDG